MSNKGIVFNIQKFSIHDGPGIRTTVFLKGCPLCCKWCSNPESQAFHIEVSWDASKCTHCLQCVKHCPNQAITTESNRIVIHNHKALYQHSCITNCPTHALQYEGEYKTVADIVSICLQDRDFYEESNGGVTISGGEGMGQPSFLKALVRELKNENIHVAIETTGYIKPDIFKELAPDFDLLLFDFKHYDSTQHFIGTAVKNTWILENLKWAVTQPLELLPRIPVIPSFNATTEDAKEMAKLFKDININRVQLLPFHQFGEKKYDAMNREYALKGIPALYPEDLQEYQNVFISEGIDCFF